MLSMIIPVYNEEETISQTIDNILFHLKKLNENWELIVVNDGSDDRTAEVLVHYSKSIKVVSHPVNSGYGKSLKTGISHAVFDNIMIIDGDGTYPEEEIIPIYNEFKNGYDLLIGNRDIQTDTFIQKIIRFFYKVLLFLFVGEKVDDANSGLRVFRKSLMMDKLAFFCNGFSFTTSQTLIFISEGYIWGNYPIQYRKRQTSSKTKLFKDSLRTFQYMMEIIIRYNPLKLFLFLSVPLVFLFLISVIFLFISQNNLIPLIAIILFSAINLFYGLAFLTYSVAKKR